MLSSIVRRLFFGGTILAVASGCAPRLIKDYDLRKHEVVFAVQEGSGYALGDCKRASDGKLTECRLYEVEFD